jgi:hypothetical protein
MATSYTIKQNVIGLIVRGKQNDSHSPGNMEQHADCILPNGQPVGFFGGGGDASSGSSGSTLGSSIGSWANGPSISFNSTGINMKGNVAYHADMKRIRPMYIDSDLAKKYKVKSTVLLLQVSPTQAKLFSKYWAQLKLNPGAFNLLGGNCSTHASEAFMAAHIVSSGIPGLDTPNNLYKQLKEKYPAKSRIFSGYIGAKHISGEKYDLVVE